MSKPSAAPSRLTAALAVCGWLLLCAAPRGFADSELGIGLAPTLVYRTDADRLLAADTFDRALALTAFYAYEALSNALEITWSTRLRGFSTFLSLPVRRSFYAAGSDAWGTNVPWQSLLDLDTTLPFRGWVAWETPSFGVRLARDRLAIGQGYWSPMMVNAQAPYFDYLQAWYGFGGFRLSEQIIRLNPTLISDEERTNQALEAYNNSGDYAAYTERAKTVVMHALQWRPARWLELGLGEALIVGGRALQLSDLNPMLVFHDFYGEDWGNVFGFMNLAVTLPGQVRLYADAAVDDLTAPTETGVSSAPPPAWGALAGLQVRNSLSPRLSLFLVAEVAYVSPTFGQRTKPLQAPYSRILYLDNTVGGRRVWVDYPLGYYLGNDLIDGRTRLEADWGWGTLFAGYHELWKGQEELGGDPQVEGTGIHRGFLPRGVVEKTREVSAGLSLKPGPTFEIGLEGALRFTENPDHAGGGHRRDFDVTLRVSKEFLLHSSAGR